MIFLVHITLFAIETQACIDNVLWRDSFGWSCRDYSRDPRECSSNYAVSNGGIEAQEACCACVKTVERRRDYASCLGTCTAEENACESECVAERTECQFQCNEDYEEESDPGGITEDDGVSPPGNGNNGIGGIETWLLILVVLGILLCLCIICIVVYCLYISQDEGTCEDGECPTQQPMLVGGGCDTACDGPCESPCDAPYNYPGQQRAYNQVPAGYPQEQRW